MYCSDINTLILISLLKQHGIKNVIASPGTTNISFVMSVQNDNWFTVFSAVDERSAAYMACGLSQETNEPVVLSCTGATASRNYLPGLTEAYYKNLPILAVTSGQNQDKKDSLTPQFLDRTERMGDVVKTSFQAYLPKNELEENLLITNINKVILNLFGEQKGPVHINLISSGRYEFNVKSLPLYRKIEIIDDFKAAFSFDSIKKICIFIGSHPPFTNELQNAIDSFCFSHNAVVFCDQTSNYRGKYRILANLICQQEKDLGIKDFDLIIHIGSVSGAYLPIRAREVWRVSADGVVRDLFGKLTKVFKMTEFDFFTHFLGEAYSDKLFNSIKEIRDSIEKKIPDIPFSNVWIASQTSKKIKTGVMHFAILNSLRSWNLFETCNAVACFSNTGGFGIDGCLSSFIGAASSDIDAEFYGIFGDLSFFYDINSLLNPLTNNLHIMVINNGIGIEFKNYSHPASRFGSETDKFVAACGHNGEKSILLLKEMCKKLGIIYLASSTKDEYIKNETYWIEKHDRPILHEVFVNEDNEKNALNAINHIAIDKSNGILKKIKKSFIGKSIKRFIKRKSRL